MAKAVNSTFRAFGGIGLLANLRSLNVISMLEEGDLAPLAPRVKLEKVSLSSGPCRNADVFLHLPALKEFQCFEDTLDAPSVIESLKARGVAVKIYR
jgi:hypothetical protein